MNITFTGVDSKTNLNQLFDLIRYDSRVEIGVLYTKNPDGRNRYPDGSKGTGNEVINILQSFRKTSLHICGKKAREQLIKGELSSMTFCADRIQVNGALTVEEVEFICKNNYGHEIITQHNVTNHRLLQVKERNHSILVDGSGGQGKSPESWIVPETSKKVGFAGGLGEDNIIAELAKINKLSKDDYWIDMEGKLRVDDWFSVDKVSRILNLVNNS